MTHRQIILTPEHENLIKLMTADGKMTYEEAVAEVVATQEQASRSAVSEGFLGIGLSLTGMVICAGWIWLQWSQGRFGIILTALLVIGLLSSIRFLWVSMQRVYRHSVGKGNR